MANHTSNRILRCAMILAIALILAAPLSALHAEAPGLRVDLNLERGTISKYVYGANYGPWAIAPPDMVSLAEKSGVTFLRFPAGEWGDENDLSEFHFDLFMPFARRLNAEPFVSTRMKGGTPEKAAALVRYVNIEKKYDVRYWSIGNEPDLFGTPDLPYTAQEHAKAWRPFAEAMLKVDPTIKLIGPDVSQYPPTTTEDSYSNVRREWLRTFLKANSDLVSVVSFHRYPLPKQPGETPTIADLASAIDEWDTIIPDVRALIRETTGRDIPVAIMEVNSNWTHDTGGVATTETVANAVWWTAALGRMINQQVEYVAFFALVTTAQPYGLLGRYDPRPTYYTYQLYQRFGTQLIGSESTLPSVTITAARRADGKLTLMITNMTETAIAAPLIIGETVILPAQVAEAYRLDAGHKADLVENGVVDGAVTLPPLSATLLIIG